MREVWSAVNTVTGERWNASVWLAEDGFRAYRQVTRDNPRTVGPMTHVGTEHARYKAIAMAKRSIGLEGGY